jgi:hypothetical protein
MDNIEQLRKVATRAGKLLTSLSEYPPAKRGIEAYRVLSGIQQSRSV